MESVNSRNESSTPGKTMLEQSYLIPWRNGPNSPPPSTSWHEKSSCACFSPFALNFQDAKDAAMRRSICAYLSGVA